MSKSPNANFQHIDLLTKELYEVQSRRENLVQTMLTTAKNDDVNWKNKVAELDDKIVELQQQINRAHSDLSTMR